MRKPKFKDGDRMDCKEIREMYKLMFAEYPDIVTVKDLQAMLGIKIPKINVIEYVLKRPCGQTRVSA